MKLESSAIQASQIGLVRRPGVLTGSIWKPGILPVILLALCSTTLRAEKLNGLDFFELERIYSLPDANLSTERSREIEEMWAYPENVRRRFDTTFSLERDDRNAYFRRALSIYEKALKEDSQFIQRQKEVRRLLKDNDDPQAFESKPKRDAIRNSFSYERLKTHLNLAQQYDAVLQLLDSGKAGSVEGAGNRQELYLESLRLSVIHFVAARKYEESLWRLRRYFQLQPNAAQEWPFQYYTAITFSHLLDRARNRPEPVEKQWRLQSLRDRYILNYLRLRYGEDSYRYKTMYEKLRREAGPMHFLKDEPGSTRP